MFLRYNDEKRNSNTVLTIVCDGCNKEFDRIQKNNDSLTKKDEYDKDYCTNCWRKKLNNRPEYKKKMSESIRNMYKNNPDIIDKKRKSMKGKNKGETNAMKRPEVAAKSKESRKKYL